MKRILVVDDSPTNLQLLVEALEPRGHEVLTVSDGATALSLCGKVRPDLILLDVDMPGLDGITVCKRLKAMGNVADVPVIFITGLSDWSDLLLGFQAGGADYITKPFRTEEVLVRVDHHLRLADLARALAQRNAELEARVAELQAAHASLTSESARRRQTESALRAADDQLLHLTFREAERWGIAGFVGQSPVMAKVLDEVRRLHQSASTNVLITGESGTGKELVARAIHQGSPRSGRPFVAVNCVAISADLAESVFFGHVKGAFTGATGDHKGHFELAHGGTLFLDEVGDMPVGLQAKLLRVLEDGMVRPVGSQREIKTDVRVLSATNANLGEKIANGAFREDLYYRLARFHVFIPPLRERRQDIPALVQRFIGSFAQEMGVKAPQVSAAAMKALASYTFAGNVRELRNVLERALIRSGGDTVEVAHIGLESPVSSIASHLESRIAQTAELAEGGIPLNLRDAELWLMRQALRKSEGNVSQAARLLGVHRSKLYRVL